MSKKQDNSLFTSNTRVSVSFVLTATWKLTVLSPFLGADAFLGNRMSLERYSFRRCTLAWRDSVDLLRRRGSTEMPIVRAVFLWMPAAYKYKHVDISEQLKPSAIWLLHVYYTWWAVIRIRGSMYSSREYRDSGDLSSFDCKTCINH